jgi:integration host factor subunit beta
MTRSELIERLAIHFAQLTRTDIDLAVKNILGAISSHLAQGGRVEIRGFGSFSLHSRPPRLGRNPKTGEPVKVPKKYVPHFKSGVELRERVNIGMRNSLASGSADGIDDETQDPLWMNKRERQALSRAQVRSGERTQESMHFIPPALAREAKVRYRG